MKEIKAFIRPESVDAVLHALEDAGLGDLTLIPVQAMGALMDPEDARFSTEFLERYSRVTKLELICSDEKVERALDLILRLARTGLPGDGVVSVTSVDELIRIRTGRADS